MHSCILSFFYYELELKRSNDTYSSKLQSEKYKEKDLINLTWKIKEVTELDEMGRYMLLQGNQCNAKQD